MDELKLHLGCGKRYLKGYIHLDLSDYPHIDYKHDAKTLPMFKNNSVSLIYASHTLEYFDRIEAAQVLNEWFRVLKAGGILRLAVPNIEALIEIYLTYKDLGLILGPLYGKMQSPGMETAIYHKTVYDYNSLSGLLKTAGFKDIRKWDWRTIFTNELKDFDDYSQAYIPHMQKDSGILISLNMEGEK